MALQYHLVPQISQAVQTQAWKKLRKFSQNLLCGVFQQQKLKFQPHSQMW